MAKSGVNCNDLLRDSILAYMRATESMILCAFQIGTGLALGSVFSLLLFKRRMWPLTFGLGAGFGMGYANCQNDINSKKWSIWTIQENLYYIVILNTSRSNLDIAYVLNIIQAAYLINLSIAGRKNLVIRSSIIVLSQRASSKSVGVTEPRAF